MKNVFIIFMFLFFTFNCIQLMHAMDYDRQQKIVLHLSDGDFILEKWKIFESIALHQDYLRLENYRCKQQLEGQVKKITPKFCTITKKQAHLFSSALDIHPGEDFKKYFDGLSLDQRHQLILITGKYDNKNIPQLYTPFLISQICNAFFPSDIEKNIQLGVSKISNYCKNQIIRYNSHRLIISNLITRTIAVSRKDLRIQKVPYDIAERDDYTYDGPYFLGEIIINDQLYRTISSINLDGDDVYSLELIVPNPERNDLLLWIVNNKTQQNDSILIQKVGNYIWSRSGKYLITYSGNKITVSVINIDENYILSRITSEFTCSHPIHYIEFNEQKNILAVFLKTENNHGIVKIMRLCKNQLIPCFEEKIGISHKSLFSSNGTKLFTESFKDDTSYINMYDLENDSTIKTTILSEVKEAIFINFVLSPDGKQIAVVTIDGILFFINVQEKRSEDHRENLLENLFYGRSLKKAPYMVYSPDGSLLAIGLLSPFDCVTLWNTCTKEKIITIPERSCGGMGFSSDSKQLFRTHDIISTKRQLLCPESESFLTQLAKLNLYELCIVQRLYKAARKRDIVNLYQEEPAYKALQALSENVKDFISNYLPYTVIKNNEALSATVMNLFKKSQDWLLQYGGYT